MPIQTSDAGQVMDAARLSEQLHLKRQVASYELWQMSKRFWDHPDVVEIYPHFRSNLYWMSCASVSLLDLARERCEQLAGSDPVAAALIPYFRQLAAEETGHDIWHLEDLEALGISREEVLARLPPPTMASLVGAQYYWILHVHPVALLGFLVVAEGDPPSVDLAESLIKKTGLPRESFRYFLRHAILEPGHNDLFDRILDSLPVTERHWSLVGVSLLRTAHLVASTLKETLEAFETGRITPFKRRNDLAPPPPLAFQ